MTILSKNQFGKGEASSFTLNKSGLAALINNTYYSNTANWSRVVIIYKSLTGSQTLKVTFDCSEETPVGIFYASEKSLDEFLVSHIEVFDFDNGSYVIKRSSLNFSEFDINLTEASLIWDMTSIAGSLTVEEGENGQLTFSDGINGVLWTGVITKSLVLNYVEFYLPYFNTSGANYTGLAAGPGSNIGNCVYGAYVNTSGGLAIIRNGQPQTNFFSIPLTGVYVRIVKKTDRLEMYFNGVLSDTLIYSGDLYGYVSNETNAILESFVINNNVVDEGNNNNVVTGDSIVWDFVTTPEYSELNSEIVSTFASLTSNSSTLLFSNEGYVFGNGIEITYTVDNSFFSGGAKFQFLGVTNSAKSIYAGYYRDSSFYTLGVNNLFSTGYSLPSDEIIEYKIKILPTSTEFYINGSLASLKSSAFGVQLQETDIVYPTVRFNNAYNLKGFLINSLT